MVTPAHTTERIDDMPEGPYYTYDDPEDIKLCLECPYETCNNCLSEPHDTGVRPAHRSEDARLMLAELIKENKYPLWLAARMSHSSLRTARRIQAQLVEAGEL